MKEHVMEINKEVFEKAQANNNRISPSDYVDVFGMSTVMGYGVYNPFVYQKDDKYFCKYFSGSSCD